MIVQGYGARYRYELGGVLHIWLLKLIQWACSRRTFTVFRTAIVICKKTSFRALFAY
jgi:hypothetical protein